MSEQMKERKENTDETLLLVSGSKGSKDQDKDYVKKLSNAITQVIVKHDVAKLRCVGAASSNNAAKSVIIAETSDLRDNPEKKEMLVLHSSFTTIKFQGEEKTGMIYKAFWVDSSKNIGIEKEEDVLLLVSGNKGTKDQNKDYVKKLSNAVVQVVDKHEVANLRCVGAASIHNAFKAVAIAEANAGSHTEDVEALKGEQEEYQQDRKLVSHLNFTTVKFQGEEKTGIIFETFWIDSDDVDLEHVDLGWIE